MGPTASAIVHPPPTPVSEAALRSARFTASPHATAAAAQARPGLDGQPPPAAARASVPSRLSASPSPSDPSEPPTPPPPPRCPADAMPSALSSALLAEPPPLPEPRSKSPPPPSPPVDSARRASASKSLMAAALRLLWRSWTCGGRRGGAAGRRPARRERTQEQR